MTRPHEHLAVRPKRLARRLDRLLRDVERRVPDALAGSVEAVHRGRVASRRLRELLRALDSLSCAAAVRRNLRPMARRLGVVRELDVARTTLVACGRLWQWPAGLLLAVERDLAEARDRGRAGMRSARRNVRFVRAARTDLARRVQNLDSRTVAVALATSLVERARRLGRALDEAGTHYAAESLHALRLAVKKLRYSLELAEDVAGLPAAREVRALRRMQERLGRLHDLHVLQVWLARVAATWPAAAPRHPRTAAADVEAECRRIHAGIVGRADELRRLAERTLRDLAWRLVPPRASGITTTRVRAHRVAG
jgi:CHAD domain-containing protein